MVKKAKDYYEIMEVSYDISKEDLKRAYYYLAKLYHPDINPRTGNLFKEITEAYNVLKDPIKRREYDLSQGIKSSVICDDLDKAAKYSETTDDDISDQLKNVYTKLKNKNLNEDELFDIIADQLNIVDDMVGQFTKSFIKAKKEEEEYSKKQAKDDMDFPFSWYEENQYYKNIDSEPIFRILEEFQNYKFEECIKNIWNRSIIAIFGVMLVYLFSLPLIVRNKCLESFCPTNAMKNHKYKIKWLRYFVYLLYKGNFLKTLGWTLGLNFLIISKVFFNISYCIYWIFDKIIKYFIFPIAYAFRWIIVFFTVIWLLSYFAG